MIQGRGCPAAWGGLWHLLAACGSLWRKAAAPIYYDAQSLGLAGWQAGRMVAGWLDGWMEVVGITAVT